MNRQTSVLIYLAMSAAAWSASADTRGHAAWQSIGPAPPAINVPVVADPASHTIYIGSFGGGVLKSTNGGATFQAVNNGLGGKQITGLAVVPNHPDIVYVNTLFDGFFKTTDGGAHWLGGNWGGFSLLMDPSNPNIMYSTSSFFDCVMKTVDGGNTWICAADGLGAAVVIALAIDPRDSNVLYAGSIGQGAFKSTDGAHRWTPIKIDPFTNALLVDPDDSNVVYAGTDRHGVYKSINAGRSFTRIDSPHVASILSLTKSGQTLYAGTATEGVSESIDGGRTWKNSAISSGYGNALSVDTAGTVYAGTSFDGVLARSISDSDWRRLGWNQLSRCACQNGDALAIDPGDHDHIFFTAFNGGLLVTEDGGRHWSDGGAHGLTSNAPLTVAFDPQEPRRVYAGSLLGGLFKSNDRGKHWQRRHFGPVDITVYGVAVDPVDHSVYAGALDGNGVWKSTDYGDTFTRIDRAPGAPPGVYLGLSGRLLTVDPHHHSIVYVPDDGAVKGLWRSPDAGKSWIEVDATQNFTSVTVDPTDSSVVYATGSNFGDYTVLKSIDGGASFRPRSVGLPVGIPPAFAGYLLVNPQHPNVLYVGVIDSSGGMFKSIDAAETWFPISSGLDDKSITGLAIDPDAPDTVYAATFYRSVYKTVTGGR